MIIGISGVAGSGKDTLFSLISSRVKNCKRYSLADELKKEVTPWCLEQYSIDPLNCTREEKELIRDFLVFHASRKRQETNGRYWIDKIANNINNSNSNQFHSIITDIRYDDFENDEVNWLKNELGGVLIHVSQYKVEERLNSVKKVFRAPANSEESRNEPKLQAKADYKISWPEIENLKNPNEELGSWVDELLFQIGYNRLNM